MSQFIHHPVSVPRPRTRYSTLAYFITCDLGLIVLVSCGCWGRPPTIKPPKWDPEGLAAKAMEGSDTDGDGGISLEEAADDPVMKTAIGAWDISGDRVLQADEIARRIRDFKEMKTGVSLFPIMVTLDGQPLPDATVSLTPADFLAGLIEPATGTTGQVGRVVLVIDREDLPGVRYGVYRVEISKLDENGEDLVPARYNSETELGLEVGPGKGRTGDTLFTLKSH